MTLDRESGRSGQENVGQSHSAEWSEAVYFWFMEYEKHAAGDMVVKLLRFYTLLRQSSLAIGDISCQRGMG